MKGVYKNLALILSLIFALSIVGVAYYLYIFPERMANQTQLFSLMEADELSPVLQELYIICGISLALGFLTVLLLMYSKSSEEESNVVYIEKFRENKSSEQKGSKSEADQAAIDEELAEISQAVKKEKNPKKKAELLLSMLAKKMEASQGAIYVAGQKEDKNIISLFASYAFVLPESQTVSYEFGEGLAGQVAKEKKLIHVADVPEGYISILSGLGEAKPAHLIICPIEKDDQLVGVAEMASFKKLSKHDEDLVNRAVRLIADELSGKKQIVNSEK